MASTGPAPRRRLAAWLAVVATGMILLPACSSPPPPERPTASGTLVISFKDDLKTLDPAFGYDADAWSIERQIYNGLLDYDGFTTTLRPDIAADLPTLTNGGKTYTFKIRKGVQFSNGRAVTAEDFKYSWERMLDPKLNGPMIGGPFWGGITGVQDFFSGRTDHIPGIKAVDPEMLEVDLDSPNQAFLNVVAMPFGFVVPKEAVAAAGSDFAHKPLGTGPFVLDRWTPGQLIVLRKNPTYFGTKPYLTEVDAQIGVSPDVAYVRMQNGQVDLPQPDVNLPGSVYSHLTQSQQWKGRVVSANNFDVWYLAMNVSMKPFDNVLVRKAFNYVVNKAGQVGILGGRAIINNGIQPPPMPGTASGYNPLGLDRNGRDVLKAKDLLEQAGYDRSHPFPPQTLVYQKGTAEAEQEMAAIEKDFQEVGITVTPKGLSVDAFLDVTGRPNTTALSYNGYIEDFPDPSDFVDPLLTCASANVIANGSNVAFYCNKDADALADKARGDSDPTDRLSLYRQFQDIVAGRDFPWVPLYSSIESNVSALRVHGYHVHPVWPLVLMGVWVSAARAPGASAS